MSEDWWKTPRGEQRTGSDLLVEKKKRKYLFLHDAGRAIEGPPLAIFH